jgi:hypothetical protein
MTRAAPLALVVAILAVAAAPRQQVDASGVPVRWNRAELTIDVLQCPDAFSGIRCSDLLKAAHDAAAVWTRNTSLHIAIRSSLIPINHVREDGRNTLSIQFYPPCTGVVHKEAKRCADPHRYGHTTVYPARKQPGADHREIKVDPVSRTIWTNFNVISPVPS